MAGCPERKTNCVATQRAKKLQKQNQKKYVATQRATPGECPLCHKLALGLKKQVGCWSRSGRAMWRPVFGAAAGFAEVEQWGILNFPEQQRASVGRPSCGYFWKFRDEMERFQYYWYYQKLRYTRYKLAASLSSSAIEGTPTQDTSRSEECYRFRKVMGHVFGPVHVFSEHQGLLTSPRVPSAPLV